MIIDIVNVRECIILLLVDILLKLRIRFSRIIIMGDIVEDHIIVILDFLSCELSMLLRV